MIPRGVLDIGWFDLAAAVGYCFRRGDRDALTSCVEGVMEDGDRDLACLSVRSGFDLVLTALSLPEGSEVLVSAITIRDMVRIIREHGLVPVPVDLDMSTLSLDMDALRRARSPRTRAILVAHLFGSRMPLDEVASFAEEHGVLLFEDCAQAFAGPGFCGSDRSDLVMFSFGPIKTHTSLGGGILRFRDPDLKARARRVQSGWPIQTRSMFLRRVLKYFAVKAVLTRVGTSCFVAVSRALGRSHDTVMSACVRGFAGPGFFDRIRNRPSTPLLALLARRLTAFDLARIGRRTEAAESVASRSPGVMRPGTLARPHTHWVFPVLAADPDHAVRTLWANGFDATRGASSLGVLETPGHRPDTDPVQARTAMDGLLYVPALPWLSVHQLDRLALTLNSAVAPRPVDRSTSGGSLPQPAASSGRLLHPGRSGV